MTGAAAPIGARDRSPWRQRSVVAVAVFLALIGGYWLSHAPQVGGDSPTLEAGARVALDCLREGNLRSCGVSPAELARVPTPIPLKSAVAPWPVLQYVPAVLLQALGATSWQVFTWLSLLSIVAVLLVFSLLWQVPRRLGHPALAPVGLLAAICMPLLSYAASTFGEALSALLVLAAASAGALRARPWVLAAAVLIGGITKETAPPFVFALVVIALLGPPDRGWVANRARVVASAVGMVAGLAVNAAFNVFRFGTLTNQEYLRPEFSVPSLRQHAENLVTLIASPNGGIVWFVAPACVFVAAVGVIGLRDASRRRPPAEWWGSVALPIVALGLLTGLARWWTPFGWNAWGPRLVLPWAPAFVLVALVLQPASFEAAVRRATRSLPRAAVVVAIISCVALPQVGVLWRPQAATDLFAPDRICHPGLTPGGPGYYACLRHGAWGRRLVLVDAYRGFADRSGLAFGLAFLAAVGGLMVLASQSLPGTTGGSRAGPRSGDADRGVSGGKPGQPERLGDDSAPVETLRVGPRQAAAARPRGR